MPNVNAARRNKPISERLMRYREKMSRRVFGNPFKIDPSWL